ncbi:hypothetical protein [Ideonella sp.]|uniref:hypothetical protein n=1 Tax=Ideonella sp. TaxID=1929293 RepID=UPI0035B0D300
MQAPSRDLATQLQGLRQQAHEDAARDIAIVRAWHPGLRGDASSRELADWLFAAAQVLTFAECARPWPVSCPTDNCHCDGPQWG